MQAHKPLAPFAGATLIEAVIARVERQVDTLALDVPPEMADAYRARFPHTVLPDLYERQLGPLCGVVTGLEWLDGDWLATFPCDTPFLPHDLVAQLVRRADKNPVVAVHDGRVHPVCTLWPKSASKGLRDELANFQSMRATLQGFGAVECDIAAPAHAFFNVNAPQDLQEALLLRAQADEASRRP